MDIGIWLKDWAISLSAGATLLLALAAFWAIWQNHNLQKRERKERLLNEIIEWAVDVAKCGSTVNIQPPQPVFSMLYEKALSKLSQDDKAKLLEGIKEDDDRLWLYRHMDSHFRYQIVDARGEYIIAVSLPFDEIILHINKVKKNLEHFLGVHWDFMKDMDDRKVMEKVNKWEKRLQGSAVTLIKKAGKIKTAKMI